MRSWLGLLSSAALVAAVGMGCGNSTGTRNRDAGNNLDASAAGGARETGGSSGGATSSGTAGTTGTSASAGKAGDMASGGIGGGAGGTRTGGASETASAGRDGGVGGARTGGSSGTASAGRDGGLGDAGGSAPGPDALSADAKSSCEMWQTRTGEQDTLDLQQYGFFKAGTVLEGKLGDLVETGSTPYAGLSVTRVRAGVCRYEGLESAVHMDRALYDQLGKGAQITAGFGQTHPLVDSGTPVPIWELPQALVVKSSTLSAEVLGFHAWSTPNVAVVRVEELPTGEIRFALVESLRGSLPASFVVTESGYSPPLGLTVGSTWIGGFSEPVITTVSRQIVTLIDLRPNTSEARKSVMDALQSLEPAGFATRYLAGLEQAKADAIRLRLAWMYNQADLVTDLEVTGIGDECCTGAGGIFYSGSVVELLHGQAPAGQVLTGGHAYYAKKACGDRFLFAFASKVALADGLKLACAGGVNVNAGMGTRIIHELPATADNLAQARQWVSSAPPLLRLYPAGKDLAASAFAPPPANALWSTPLPALTAVMAGTPVVLAVQNVSQRADGYVVRLRTPFYTDELAHLELRDVDAAFACADPRLVQTGARWFGVVVGTEALMANNVTTPLEQGRLWLAPGFLLPERSDLKRAFGLVPKAVVH